MAVTRSGPGTAKVAATLKGLGGLQGKVGWFEGATYPDGTSVAYVATIHEFGTSRIRARPFMRPAIADHGQEWMDNLAAGARQALAAGTPARDVLEAVTLAAAGNVGEKIAAVTSPALSPATVARKRGNPKPLIDTSQMLQSVTGKVESE